MINAIAIDDEPPALQIIEAFAGQVSYLKLLKTFTNVQEALKYLASFPVDLVFMDIQMPGITGLEVFKEIDNRIPIILTTAFSQYAVEGFNLNAADYLLKPYTPQRFAQAVEKVKNLHYAARFTNTEEPASILIRADYSLIKVFVNDILYVEGLDDYLKIYTTQGKPIVARLTLKGMLEKLPPAQFMRVHRSFIVNMDRVMQVKHRQLVINGSPIPISNTYEEAVVQRLSGVKSSE